MSTEEIKPEDNKNVSGKTGALRVVFDSAKAKVETWKETACFSIIAFAAVAGLAAIGWSYLHGPGWEDRVWIFRRGSKVEAVVPAAIIPTMRRALDGVRVTEGTPEPDYIAVMIDNIAEALPQSSVAKAPLVIEAPVEGGLTRLMVVFPSNAAFTQLGPVRSARPYYIDWAEEFGALYVHVGGSPAALEKLKSAEVRDLNEFFAGRFFWRDGKRYAPHNAYVSSVTLADAMRTRPRTAKPLSPWKYKDDEPLVERPAEILEVALGEQGKWRVRWRYDRETNAFARILASGPQLDDDGQAVLAKNVLVQFAKVKVLDDIGRRSIDTVSGGDASVIMDGRIIGGTWKYDRSSARTLFYDAAGNELALNAGITWVEVVPIGTPITH